MSKVWYCQINGKEYGPIDSAKLRSLANEKKILPEHLVRQSPENPWVPANRVVGLFKQAALTSKVERLWKIKTSSRIFEGITDQQLKQLARSGQLKRDHLLWVDGKDKWFKANSVKDLFPPQVVPPPIPQTFTVTPATIQPTVEDAVEIQRQEITTNEGENITFSSVKKFFSSLLPQVEASVDYRPSKNNTQFYGPGTLVDLGYGPLSDALVYATGGKLDRVRESSLIELGLPVATRGALAERLGYWPTYHECNPNQRARYLAWLYEGRTGVEIDLGYVFIFFYGLERRIVVDGADHKSVAKELIRLLALFGYSNSFTSYATRLLWLTLFFSVDHGGVPDDLLAEAIVATKLWRDGSLELYLAYLSRTQSSLDGEACFAWAGQDQRTMKSIVCDRHAERFKELFLLNVKEVFPSGVAFLPITNLKPVSYHPASGTLGAFQMVQVVGKMVPTLESRKSPCTKLIKIWNDCVEQLKSFDRASRRATGELTSEMYEALPIQLRDGDHPELNRWNRLISQVTDENGWTLVNVNELARIKGIKERDQLTKTQCLSILNTADALGYAIEPDCRIGGKNFRWNDPVAIFTSELSKCDERSLEHYRIAALLLELGLSVAASDNEVDERELAAIESHLEAELDLPPNLSKRLAALRQLMISKGPKLVTIPQKLLIALTNNQKKAIGAYLVSVATADQVITPKERSILKSAFQKLTLPIEWLTELLAPYETKAGAKNDLTPADSPSVAPILDFDRIRRIREETRHVQELLHEAIVEDYSEEHKEGEITDAEEKETALASVDSASNSSAQTVAQPIDSRIAEVPARYQAFCSTLLQNERWNLIEAQELARKQGLMFSATLEAINEWSTDALGDWLVEEADTELIIHAALLENK